jgi:hypothetical protein
LSALNRIPEFWFDRLIRRTNLPMWAAAIVFGTGPFLFLVVIVNFISGQLILDVRSLLVSVLYTLGVSFSAFYLGRYIRERVERLLSYAHEMMTEKQVKGGSLDLSKLSSTSMIGLVWLVVLGASLATFTIGSMSGTFESNLVGLVPYIPSHFILATLFWTFGYSMYSISKIGGLPMTLKPYTQDRTLGLRPFASASFSFTIIYLALATLIVSLGSGGGEILLHLELLTLVLYPLGLVLFLLPLWSLHRKLMDSKMAELRWLEPRATSVLQRLKAEQGMKIEPNMVYEITAIDKIERDISRIRSWPFDLGILARLLTFVILPLTLTLVGRELIVIFLGR